MTTLSIPISGDLEKFIEGMIRDGKGANKADVVRRALKKYEEHEIVERILQAQSEPTLRGDLKDLMKKFK
jgi:Arc/MetJ-type ribon-helix-helix transcriptional regulator